MHHAIGAEGVRRKRCRIGQRRNEEGTRVASKNADAVQLPRLDVLLIYTSIAPFDIIRFRNNANRPLVRVQVHHPLTPLPTTRNQTTDRRPILSGKTHLRTDIR